MRRAISRMTRSKQEFFYFAQLVVNVQYETMDRDSIIFGHDYTTLVPGVSLA